jgi:predicted acetyltransferase
VTQTYPIRAIEPAEFPAFLAVTAEAFHSSRPVALRQQAEELTFEFDRSAAAFDEGEMVGTSSAYTLRLSVPGGMVATGGISNVAVVPTSRRRGIMSALIRHLLAEIAGRGEPVAALWSSEPEIYGRFGFGCASEDLQLRIPRGDGRMIPPLYGPGAPRLRIASPERVGAELAAVYEAVATRRPGLLARDDRWWRARIFDPEEARDGLTALRVLIAEDDGGPRGYAFYRVKPEWDSDAIPASKLMVGELMATDPQASAALWSDLLTRDLVGEVRVESRPVDDELIQLLAGRRRARAGLTDGLWIRLIDLPAALSQRRYATDLDLVVEVTDTELPANTGRWRLKAAAFGPASCERVTETPDLVAPVEALGAAYLGGTRLGALAAAGLLREDRPGAVAELSAAMSWDPAPWCPMVF